MPTMNMKSLETWDSPPLAKVYEALTAVADGRVHLSGPTSASVVSSQGDRTYFVEWLDGFVAASSNDNASYWRGYIGYPIVAVMLRTGVLAYAPHIAALLRGVQWKEVNMRHRNDYDAAVAAVLGELSAKGVPTDDILDEVNRVFGRLRTMRLGKLPPRLAPPKDPQGSPQPPRDPHPGA
jgi:hypothetical protein